MKTAKILILAVVLSLLGAGVVSAADTATANLTINANINAKAQLSLNAAAITFDDSDWNGTDEIPVEFPCARI